MRVRVCVMCMGVWVGWIAGRSVDACIMYMCTSGVPGAMNAGCVQTCVQACVRMHIGVRMRTAEAGCGTGGWEGAGMLVSACMADDNEDCQWLVRP